MHDRSKGLDLADGIAEACKSRRYQLRTVRGRLHLARLETDTPPHITGGAAFAAQIPVPIGRASSLAACVDPDKVLFGESIHNDNCDAGDAEAESAMLPDAPTLSQLSKVISEVTAPAFLLGAVAAFISVLIARMNRIIDRSQALHAIRTDDPAKADLKSDIPRLKQRAALLNKAILFAILSAIVTSLLVIVAFVAAYLNFPHEYGVGVLFVLALSCFTVALTNLARETRIALHEHDYFSSS